MQIEMTADQVGPFVKSLPADAAVPGSGIVFFPAEYADDSEEDPGELIAPAYLLVPEAFEAAAEALLAAGLPAVQFSASKAQRQGEVNALRDAALVGGFQHNFGGTAGIRTLDTRNDADAINWLGLSALADKLVAAGAGSNLLELRDSANGTFSASAATVADAMVAMGQWRSSVLAHSWALKDAIGAAGDQAALDAIDITNGW